jgi:DNA polymerase-3 subunit gamma/tau
VPRHNISIRDAISGKTEIPEVPVKSAEIDAESLIEDELPQGLEQDFDQDKLEVKWALFAESIQAEKPRMSIALRSRQPVLKPEFEVEVILENSTLQEDFIANVKAHMQSFLRKELFNDSVKVTVKLDDIVDDGKRKMYTTEEKFQFLINKNPAVARLKQQFNLELE